MSTRDLKHVPRHYCRANERGVALTSGVDEIAVYEVVVIELCDPVRSDERQRTIRVLELMDQAFWKSSKEGGGCRSCTPDATVEGVKLHAYLCEKDEIVPRIETDDIVLRSQYSLYQVSDTVDGVYPRSSRPT